MTAADIITIIIATSGFISAISVIYAKLVKPIKTLVDKIEKHQAKIADLQEQLKDVNRQLRDGKDLDAQNLGLTMKSIIAILDGLEQNGANGTVTRTKKELIQFLAENLNPKK